MLCHHFTFPLSLQKHVRLSGMRVLCFSKRIRQNGKIQLFEFNYSDLRTATSSAKLDFVLLCLEETLVWKVWWCASLVGLFDLSVPLICYTVPPCSPRTQCLANSHIAGIMKLMFHRPLLGHDKMDEKEEKRWEEQEIRPDGEEGEKTTLFSGLCAFLFFFCSWQKGSIEDKASVCWFWFIVLIFCESCPYKLQRC